MSSSPANDVYTTRARGNRTGDDWSHRTPNLDTTKGKIKKAVADLTDSDKLHREGERDVMAGKAKSAIDTARDAFKSKK